MCEQTRRVIRSLILLLTLIGQARVASAQSPDPATRIADTTHVVERGRLFIYRRQNLIGAEHYDVERRGDSVVMRATHGFSERNRPTSEVTAQLRLDATLAPVGYQLSGDRRLSVTVANGTALISDEKGDRRVPTPAAFFTAVGPAPYAVPMMLVRYWLAHGRPDTIPLLPYGRAVVRLLGKDTLPSMGASIVLDRYSIRGLDAFWGGLTLWLDREEALMAAVGGDDSREAIRERFQNAMPFFIRRSVADAVAAAEVSSRGLIATREGTYALIGGTLIDGTGRPPVRDATVVIRSGRIIAAGPRATTRIPPAAARADVTGMSILPGLWDMHTHLDKVPDFLTTYLAVGVTTVRDMGNETEWSVAFRDGVAHRSILGPRLLLAGMIDGRSPGANGLVHVATPTEARRAVRGYYDAGYDQIKIYGVVSPALVPVITAEAHRLGLTVSGHIPAGMSAVHAVDAGMDQVSHLWSVFNTLLPDSLRFASRDVRYRRALALDLDGEAARALVETFRRRRTVVDPTLAHEQRDVAPLTLETEPGLRRLPPELEHVTLREVSRPPMHPLGPEIYRTKVLDLFRRLHRAGIPIVAGTDWGDLPGYSLQRELEVYVEAGMTPMEAIQSATIVPARAMRLDKELGTIEAGKRADIVVIDGDPLRAIREIRKVHAVIIGGRMYDVGSLWRRSGVTP